MTVIVACAVQILLPPLILSVVRTPWTYFTFNPWLTQLPSYLASAAPLEQKLGFLTRVAVFWFTADGQYGAPEWGFAVDGADLVRFVVIAGLVGVWVALWRYGRTVPSAPSLGRGGSTLGVFAGVIGFSTGPCSVVGCGAPVLPVVGLAFTGLSSGAVLALSTISRASAVAMLVLLVVGIVWLGRHAGRGVTASERARASG